MRSLIKKTAAICAVTAMLPAIPALADSSTVANFANFKACWKGNGSNNYLKITGDFLDGSSTGFAAYAGCADLIEKMSVSIDWALTNAYVCDVMLYALPLKDTDGDGSATAEETEAFYTASLDANKISNAAAPDLSKGVMIARLSDYSGADGGWNFTTVSLTQENTSLGEAALFITTACKDGSNGLTGNFKNLVIKESTEGKPVIGITKDKHVKSITFTSEDGKTYDFPGNEAALSPGTYTVSANAYAPATYATEATPTEVTITEDGGEAVSASSTLRTSELPETNYDTVANNVIEWVASDGYKPNSFNYIDSVQNQPDIAVAGAKQGESADADVYMLVNTQGGKIHSYGRNGAVQVNNGTVLKVPVVKDTKVTFDASSFTYTVNGTEKVGTQDYFYLADENGYAEITVISGGYASAVRTTPLSRTAVSGTVTGTNGGCIMFNDTVSGDIQYAPITDGNYSANLIDGQSYIIKYGTMEGGTFIPSDSGSTDVGGITPTGEAVTQDIAITSIREYSIGGDVVDLMDGDILKISDGMTEYDITVENGRWSAVVPNGVYTFVLTSSNGGELSPLSKNSFSVLDDNAAAKHVLVKYPVKPDSRKAITVGTGCDYETINDALEAIIANGNPASEEERVTITLKAGEIFREQVLVRVPYITFTTDARNPATITWYYGSYHRYYSVGASGEYDEDRAVAKIDKQDVQSWGAVVDIKESATDFKAENVRFVNSFNVEYTEEERIDGVEDVNPDTGYNRMLRPGDAGYLPADARAVQTMAAALIVGADRAEFKNCAMVSNQDTLYTDGGCRIYFKNCAIEGNVDYIYGSGYCVFEQCDLVSAGYSDQNGGGYITANSSKGSDGYYLFRDCTVKNSSVEGRKFGNIAWGRNWGGDTSNTYFINTKVADGVITPSGWGGWGDVSKAPMYVFDLNDPSVGENSKDNMHGSLTYDEAFAIYNSVETMMGDWTPTYMDVSDDGNDDGKDDETGYPYEIKSLMLKSETGEVLDSVPSDKGFIVDVTVAKNVARENNDYLFIAVYDKDGALLNLDYVNARFAENYDYAFGFYVPAQTSEIGSIKAFVWNNFNGAEPLAESKILE